MQDTTLPIMEELLHFHYYTLKMAFSISPLVLSIILLILTTNLTPTNTKEAQEVETV